MQTPKIQWGMFAYQLWDIGSSSGNSDRPGVSKLSLQPFIIKHFDKGWYIGTPDTPQTYDFKSDKWTWALGGQVGRVMKLGKQPVKLFGEVLYNPEDDNGPTSEWTAKFNVTFLIPEMSCAGSGAGRELNNAFGIVLARLRTGFSRVET